MSKKTTSDLLKDFMATHPQIGGKATDWKRLSKKKDDEGHYVREFENAKTKVRVTVVELSPTEFIVAGEAAKIEMSYFPAMNTSEAKEELAQELMDELVDGDMDVYDEDLADRVRAAGVAFANKFVFCYCNADGGAWLIYPTGPGFDEFDGTTPIGALLPADSEDVNEGGTWVIVNDMDPLTCAQDLMRRGFIWDPVLQASVDKNQDVYMTANQMSLIDAIEAGRKAESAVKAQPKAPAP